MVVLLLLLPLSVIVKSEKTEGQITRKKILVTFFKKIFKILEKISKISKKISKISKIWKKVAKIPKNLRKILEKILKNPKNPTNLHKI